jgi:hypothetical protein
MSVALLPPQMRSTVSQTRVVVGTSTLVADS